MSFAHFVARVSERHAHAKHLCLLAFLIVLCGVPQYAVAQCGADHQRACCVLDQGPTGCQSGTTLVNGCPAQDSQFSGDCECTVNIAGNWVFSGSYTDSSCEVISECGHPGERACCVGENGAPVGGCFSGIPIAGCSGDNCYCSSGAMSSSSCVTLTACGGEGQRACCNGAGETAVSGELVACQSGLVQVPGCDESTGNCACSDGLSTSNGTCVQPTQCGGKGQRACCVGNAEFASNGDTAVSACNSGLTLIDGCAGDCTCGGSQGTGLPPALLSTQTCTVMETIAEPDPGLVTPPAPGLPTGPECPAAPALCGYADLHVHMFAHLAHGGAALAGAPYDPNCTPSSCPGSNNVSVGGVNVALAEDYGINSPTVKGSQSTLLNIVDGTAGLPQCPVYLLNSALGNLCKSQYLFHGDHTPFDTAVYGGTNDGAASNLGTPAFNGWPQFTSTIHQQVYYKWLQRAWMGGLRLMVMSAVTNETLCKTLYRLQKYDGTYSTDCTNSMEEIDAQLNAAWAFQTWLDNQYGGPNKGWFRIVTSPQQAAAVIKQGQLAVVLGIEVENLFNCHLGADTGSPNENTVYPFEPNTNPPASMSTCTAAFVQQQVQHYYAMGVRHIFPIHNFDNAYGSPAAWQDSINIGNQVTEGQFWNTENCYSSNYGFYLDGGAEDTDINILNLSQGYSIPQAPSYTQSTSSSPYATCNSGGLTSLGMNLITDLMDQGMIIDIDHMSQHSLSATLQMAVSRSYPGIAATHVQFFDLYNQIYSPAAPAFPSNMGRHERMRTKSDLQTIKNLGGLIAVMLKDDVQDTSNGFCLPNTVCVGGGASVGGKYTIGYNGPSNNYGLNNNCRYSTTEWAQAYMFGADTMDGPVAMGSDFNGIAGHVGPRFGSAACGGSSNERSAQEKGSPKLQYPFTIEGFGTFGKQVSGQRAFDFNTDGLAHIGLLPDMVADLKNVGLTDTQLQPLFTSAQAYIDMWSKIQPPQASQFVVSAPATAVTGKSFSVTVTAEDSYGNTASTYAGTVQFSSSDGSALLPANSMLVNGVGTFTVTLNTPGTQTITATDTSNSSITGTSNSITVDQPPTINSANNTTFTVGAPGSFTVSATGFPSTMTYTESGTLPGLVTFNAGVLSGVPAANTGGVYHITMGASNGISPAASQPFTLTVDQAAAITSGNSATFTVGTVGSFTVTATGYPAPTFSQTGAPTGVSIDATTGVLSGNPAAGSGGIHVITITASNGVAPSAKQSFTLTVNEAPSITSGSGTTFTTGASGSFQVTATGYPAPTFTQTGAPSNVTINSTTGVLGGIPAAGTGNTYTVSIKATNLVSTATQSFTLIVDQPPAITSASGTTLIVGQPGSFQVTATGYPAPTFTQTGAPSNVTINSTTGVLGGIPAAGTGGPHSVTLTASNGVAPNAIQTFTLNVADFTITASPSTQTISSGHTATYAVTLSSLGGLTGNVALSCSGAPAHSTCTVSPSTVMLNGMVKTTVTLNASMSVNHGTFTLTFTGKLGTITHSVPVTLTVK